MGAMTELLLFLAARAQNLEECILPALEDGKIVICDRFHDSSMAYQGYARDLGLDTVHALCDASSRGVWPDLTFYLDVSPEVGLARTEKLEKDTASADEMDRIEMEGVPFHTKVRNAYLDIASRFPERIVVVDATQSMEAVAHQAWSALVDRIG
jgi:dTMP kinase